MSTVKNSLDFADWLQGEINKREWSQADLARYAGLSRAVVNKLLNGKTYPQPGTLNAIAHALRVPVDTAYREAGLLPKSSDTDKYIAEITHKLEMLKDPQHRVTVLRMLDALIDEEKRAG